CSVNKFERLLSGERFREELDLDPTRRAEIEGLVGVDGPHERLALGEHQRRLDDAALDQVEELGDVLSMVAVAHLDREVLVHRHPDRERLRALWIDADDRERPGLRDRLDRPREHDRGTVAWTPEIALGLGLRRDLFHLLSELLTVGLEQLL